MTNIKKHKYNADKALDLAHSTFMSCSVISKEQVVVLMVVDKGGVIWETTPPVKVFAIPCDNLDMEWARLGWGKDQWVFPLVEKSATNEYLVVDGHGRTYFRNQVTKEKITEKTIQNEMDMPCTYCNLKGLKNIHGEVYIVGSFRRVFHRDGENQWSIVSSNEMIKDAEERYDAARKKRSFYDSGFECIDGFEVDNELYAAGENSDVWRLSNKQWQPIDIGFLDEHIVSILCRRWLCLYGNALGG